MPEGGAHPRSFLSKHRLEALTDGVYAIAITLLVLELRLPEASGIHTEEDLGRALGHLLPKFTAWLISFFVLAVFWVAHHRLFQWVRAVDVKLVWINLFALLAASFLPFGAGLVGEYYGAFASQAIYAGALGTMGVIGLVQLAYLARHPALLDESIPADFLRGARIRNTGIVATALLAILVAAFDPRFATLSFMMMFVVARVSRRRASTSP